MFNNKNVKNINADEGYKLINENKNMIILDVRTKGEFESGHIPKAKNIPVQQLSTRIKELEKYKDVPILVHCASGGRSPSAVRALAKNNFTQVYHLNKGLMSWKHQLKK
ncbi:rhodanese-like domain-containing protein [Clostridium sp. YIM B02515]|uniref:Rhodanese-like domain-containing protein n=2 Tax=Clostridium rhizosphaerae TaxID=2803861 RepID=A0ABS1TGH2_9CLOT|nr:rhodanese-like domain-containing protein [Clostridium rhizosphaerae]